MSSITNVIGAGSRSEVSGGASEISRAKMDVPPTTLSEIPSRISS